MAKPLTPLINHQLDSQDVKGRFTVKINDVENDDVLSYVVRADRSFGTMSAQVTLRNPNGAYSPGRENEIAIGDELEIIEYYAGDQTPFSKFFGSVRQRSVEKGPEGTTIALQCLDLIVKLQDIDVDKVYEGTKTEIKNETLVPQFLPSPNNMYATVFNFRNNSLAETPRPIIVIRDKGNRIPEDPVNEGFEINYETGQLKMGLFLNARDNFDVICKSYYYYVQGLKVEDVVEDLLLLKDGYDNFLFGRSSNQDIIDTHLTSSLYAEDNRTSDTLIPNVIDQSATIAPELTAGVGPGGTSITVESTDGFPSTGPGSGTANINGDTFTWTGKTATTLTGVPSGGAEALQGHHTGDIVKYVRTYPPGQLWFLTYSNLLDDLQTVDFTVPGGATIQYIDKRLGMILLDIPISTASVVTYNRSYRFKTLQATGIEVNKVEFRERGIDKRFDALKKLREFVAPNYIVRTRGNRQIWGTYLNQKLTADYVLKLPMSLRYLDDEEVYTRVKLFGKNNNPTNLMFDPNVAFVSTGQQFTATASNVELTFEEDSGNYRVYKTAITDVGRIITTNFQPTVTVNGVPINDQPIEILGAQAIVDKKTQVVTTTEQHTSSTEVRTDTYVFYTVKLPHSNIDRNQSIKFYDATSTLLITLAPNDSNMIYEIGEWRVPGNQANDTIERISNADYHVRYSTQDLIIRFESVRFFIAKSIIPSISNALVKATFEYQTAVTPIRTGGFAFDGRTDTQVQTVFFAEPPTGFPYAIIDIGSIKPIQAIDISAGFFKPNPTESRRFDISMYLSLYSSTDNIDYRIIDSKTNNFRLTGGDSIQFEEDVLGEGFEARYLKMDIEKVEKTEFEQGVWVVAFTEIAAFSDIVIKTEAKLIPNTYLTAVLVSGSSTMTVNSTAAFPTTGAGYLNETDLFGYTGKTATTFTGVTGLDVNHGISERVAGSLDGDTSIYDDRELLSTYEDRLFKDRNVNTFLDTPTKLDRRARLLLREFTKNHNKIQCEVLFGPHYEVGQTVQVIDAQQGESKNYFIESISNRLGRITLELARYP